jgi:hypothetical protein
MSDALLQSESKINYYIKEDRTMKVLVAYDGTLQSKEALRYGMETVREKGGEVLALHIFNSGLFVDYDVAGADDAARKEAARHMDEARRLMSESGVRASLFAGEGDPEDATIEFAVERNVDVLLCPPRYTSIIRKFRKIAQERGKHTSEDTVLGGAEKLKMAVVSVQ